ncbi:MAG TPA: ATP-binding protein [Noviherbaspirillum sp.]|jgi:PAS domain S-box-containing protein|uniref:ATP-binding protein n=1 Tax=Noviherbaspirillum sp. TaxID=1926288 RepID=UPI002DDCFE5B|nr:ATP-binding protein [Noviherbaspirillum sp.]HEV2610084.1 ATP-binding protein [Noviherbaspirillum sp.]
MENKIEADVAAVSRIDAVPSILEVVCRTTGMGFAAVARVTEDRWVACAVRDEINFGLKVGEELKLETTICNEIRGSGQAVVIDHVEEDAAYCLHPTPAMYGFQSYISMPIFYPDGRFFGTLCSIDPKPAKLNRPEIIKMFRLFADLIMFHLNAARGEFSLELSDSLRTANSPEDIIATACELLGRRLGVSRVVYGEVDESGQYVFMRRDWTGDGVPSLAGLTKVMNDFGPELIAALGAGQVIINEDITLHPHTARYADAYSGIGVRAELLVPLVKLDRLRLVLAFHRDQPYRWTSEEIDLARDMAERTWLEVDAARAQAELRTERDQSRYIFDSMTEGFGLIDRDWTIVRMNAAGLKLLHRTEETVVGRNHWEAFPETLGTEIEALCRAGKEKHIAGSTEYPYKLPDGQTRWMEVRVSPALNDELAIFFRDITSRRRAEESLRREAKRKDEFLAMLAHELRNPLAPIGAAADLLQAAKLDEAHVQQTSRVIGRQVRHMTHLINDLLDVSRVTSGLVTLDKAPVDMRYVVTDAVEQVRPLIDAKRHHLTLHLSPDAAIVTGDGKRLVQIMANLLNNAAKYTPDGGELAIGLNVNGSFVSIEVVDNGIGMRSDLVNRAFDLFSQAERTPDRSTGGLGIGLAIVKNLVELHGGTVSCESAGLGKGSRFAISLPRLVEPDDRAAQRLGDQDQQELHRPLKILVVDDNKDAATMLGMLLKASGHHVLIEHDSLQALAIARKEALDLCLIDIGLPGMDGNALAERLRKQAETAKCTLVAVTGYGQESDRERARMAGFDHHLVKPVDTQKLFAILTGV